MRWWVEGFCVILRLVLHVESSVCGVYIHELLGCTPPKIVDSMALAAIPDLELDADSFK